MLLIPISVIATADPVDYQHPRLASKMNKASIRSKKKLTYSVQCFLGGSGTDECSDGRQLLVRKGKTNH